MIGWALAVDGKTWRFDFSAFDRYVEAMMSLGITEQISAFSMTGWSHGEIVFFSDLLGDYRKLSLDISSKEYRQIWQQFLQQFREHLIVKEWFDRTVLYFDEASPQDLPVVLDIIQSDSPRWKIGVAYTQKEHHALLSEFYDASGILGAAIPTPVAEDSIRTFYTSCTQVYPNVYLTTDSSLAEISWLAWHAAANQYDGYLRWAFDRWTPTQGLNAITGSFTAGDSFFVYPIESDNGLRPLSSLRFEALVDAIEDAEKITMLRAQAETQGRDVESVLEPFLSVPTNRISFSEIVEKARVELAKISVR